MDNYKFFQNTACEFFPCHQTAKPDEFNCLFCYCPLYALGELCGGACSYTPNGIKDCSACMLPHKKDAFDFIMPKCSELIKLACKK